MMKLSLCLKNNKERQITVAPYKAILKSLQISTSKREKGNILQTVRYGGSEIRFWIESTVKSLGMMIHGKVSKDDVSGVVGIVDMIGSTVDASPTMADVMLNLLRR